jgi:hypothetical protein
MVFEEEQVSLKMEILKEEMETRRVYSRKPWRECVESSCMVAMQGMQTHFATSVLVACR